MQHLSVTGGETALDPAHITQLSEGYFVPDTYGKLETIQLENLVVRELLSSLYPGLEDGSSKLFGKDFQVNFVKGKWNWDEKRTSELLKILERGSAVDNASDGLHPFLKRAGFDNEEDFQSAVETKRLLNKLLEDIEEASDIDTANKLSHAMKDQDILDSLETKFQYQSLETAFHAAYQRFQRLDAELVDAFTFKLAQSQKMSNLDREVKKLTKTEVFKRLTQDKKDELVNQIIDKVAELVTAWLKQNPNIASQIQNFKDNGKAITCDVDGVHVTRPVKWWKSIHFEAGSVQIMLKKNTEVLKETGELYRRHKMAKKITKGTTITVNLTQPNQTNTGFRITDMDGQETKIYNQTPYLKAGDVLETEDGPNRDFL